MFWRRPGSCQDIGGHIAHRHPPLLVALADNDDGKVHVLAEIDVAYPSLVAVLVEHTLDGEVRQLGETQPAGAEHPENRVITPALEVLSAPAAVIERPQLVVAEDGTRSVLPFGPCMRCMGDTASSSARTSQLKNTFNDR